MVRMLKNSTSEEVGKEIKISELPLAKKSLIDDLFVISQSDADDLLTTRKIPLSLIINSIVSDRKGNLIDIVDGFKLFSDKSLLDKAVDDSAKSAREAKEYSEISLSGADAYVNGDEAQEAINSGKEKRRFFPVVSHGDAWTERWENVGGVATPTGEYLPSGQFVDEVGKLAREAAYRSQKITNVTDLKDDFNEKIIGGIASDDFKVPFYVTESGSSFISGVRVINVPDKKGFVITDDYMVPYLCSPDYENNEGIPVIGNFASTEVVIRKIDVNGVMGVNNEGQSLSVGVTTPALVKIVNSTQPYKNKTFSGSIRSNNPDADTSIPLVESNYVIPGFEKYPQSETYLSAFVNELTRKMMAEHGVNSADDLPFYFFGAVHGIAGLKLSELMKSSESYDIYISQLKNAVRLANEEGGVYSELCRFYSQGESDYRDSTPPEIWEDQFIKNARDKNHDVRAITGQDFDSIIVGAQLASHHGYNRLFPSIALSMRKLAHEGYLQIGYPAYIGAYVDSVHMSPDEYIYCGKLAQRSLHRALKNNQDGKPFGITWLAIIKEKVQGNVHVYIYNVPTPPLRIKTDWVREAPNYGFEVVDRATFEYIDIITSVEVTGWDRITVITSRPLAENEVMTYGWGVTQLMGKSGRINGPRGNVCDSSGDIPGESYTDSAGTFRPMDDYAEIWKSER